MAGWLLTVLTVASTGMDFLECALNIATVTQTYYETGFSSFKKRRPCDSRKIHNLTGEFYVKFHSKSRYRTHRFAMSAIPVFRAKFNEKFHRRVMNYPFGLAPVTSQSASLSHADIFGVLNAQPVTLHPPRIRRGQEESQGSVIGGGSQPPTRRLNLPFDSLFVVLTHRITPSYTVHKNCFPLADLKSPQGIPFSETCYTFKFFRVEPPRV